MTQFDPTRPLADPEPMAAPARKRPRFERRAVVLAMGAVALAALVATLALSGKSAGATSRSTPMLTVPPLPATALTVDVVSPRQVTMVLRLAASGSVTARDELSIGSDASGARLLEVKVDVGAQVKRGQLLARGDDTQLLAQIAQQDAQIRQARAELTQAEANLERAERIKDSGVYSVEAVQTRRTGAKAAAAKLDLVQAQRRELEVQLAHTRVYAPADGVIARRSATLGAVMQPGAELFRLIRDDELEWRAEVPDHALQGVKPGAAVRVHLDETHAVEGRVRLVAPTVDAHTRNGLIYVSLPRGTPLKAGGHAQGELEIGSATLPALPESVFFHRDGQAFVYVLGEHGVARLTRVETGARQQGLVEVRGLGPATQVVATGAGFVKDGERVRVAAPSKLVEPGART